MDGMAADISISGIAPSEIAKYAESIGVLGIGLYETAADGYFVHVDTRTTKSFWYGHAQKRMTTFGGNPPKKEETPAIIIRSKTNGIIGNTLSTITNKMNSAAKTLYIMERNLQTLLSPEVFFFLADLLLISSFSLSFLSLRIFFPLLKYLLRFFAQ